MMLKKPLNVLFFDNSANREQLVGEMEQFTDQGFKITYVTPVEETLKDINLDDFACVIVGGGGARHFGLQGIEVAERELPFVDRAIDRQMPVLGICWGHQIINRWLGGEIEVVDPRKATVMTRYSNGKLRPMISIPEQSVLVEDISDFCNLIPPGTYKVHEHHSSEVTEIGEEMKRFATSPLTQNEAVCHTNAPLWTVQWHPERTPNSITLRKFADRCRIYKNKIKRGFPK